MPIPGHGDMRHRDTVKEPQNPSRKDNRNAIETQRPLAGSTVQTTRAMAMESKMDLGTALETGSGSVTGSEMKTASLSEHILDQW